MFYKARKQISISQRETIVETRAKLAREKMDAAHILIHREVNMEDEHIYYQHVGQFPHRCAESFLEAATDNEPRELLEIIANLRHVPAHLKQATINYARTETYTYILPCGQHAKYSHLGETPLIAAAKRGHFDIVKILLIEGADVSLRGVIDGEEFTAQEISRRELAKLRLVIAGVWNKNFIPTTETLLGKASEYIKNLLIFQNNLEAIILLFSPSKYVFHEAYYSSALMVEERFRGFRDAPNKPAYLLNLADLYRGFFPIPLQQNNRSAYTAGRLVETLQLECQRQGRVFRM